jgi:thiaminase/transcriptional activator TenA
MTFVAEARAETAELRAAIHALPFNRELAQGTLRRDRFQHYLIQDALYLNDYARILALLAAKAPLAADIVQFAQAAGRAILFEQAMHRSYLAEFGIDAERVRATPASPTGIAYTGFMFAEAASGGFETLLAAVLPCFSIYAEVGGAIHAQAAKGNPFRLWIDTYAAEEFQHAVTAAEAVADRVAASSAPALRRKMLGRFRRSVEFEWMFWDAAYRLESWPLIVPARAMVEAAVLP